jgi:hypothetical protein
MSSDKIRRYLSSVDWADKIIDEGTEQNNKNWLLTEISNYLSDKYRIPNTPPNKLAMWKAIELMEGYKRDIPEKVVQMDPTVNNKSDQKRKTFFKKIVLKAEKEGYLQNFELSEPWIPKLFVEGELNTYPYQHTTMISYRGVSRDHFYLGGDDPEGKGDNASKRHPESVLNLGHWNPGNTFNEDNDNAVWTTFKDTATTYAERRDKEGKLGILLEIQAPTQWVQCNAHKRREVNNLKEIQEEFGSPENYREHIKNTSDEQSAWLIRPKVPLRFIRRAWDLELCRILGEEFALPITSKNEIDLIDLMHVHQDKRIPSKPQFGSVDNHEEGEKIFAIREILNNNNNNNNKLLQDQCLKSIKNLRKIKRGVEDIPISHFPPEYRQEGINFDRCLNNMKNSIEGENYEKGINKKMIEIKKAAGELGINVEKRVNKVKNLDELQEALGNIIKITKEIDQETEEITANMILNQNPKNLLDEFVDSLHFIYFSPEFIDNAKKSDFKNKTDILAEVKEVETKLGNSLKRAKLYLKIKKRMKEAEETIRKIENKGKISYSDWWDIYNPIYSYENTPNKERGINDSIVKCRRECKAPKGRNEQLKRKDVRGFKNLLKECEKRRKKIESNKNKVKKNRKELENLLKETEKMKKELKQEEARDIEPSRVKKQLKNIESEYEKLTSRNGLLNRLYYNIKGINWVNRQKYKLGHDEQPKRIKAM